MKTFGSTIEALSSDEDCPVSAAVNSAVFSYPMSRTQRGRSSV
jgi:hypothetical protein